jgi:hypothetical protein
LVRAVLATGPELFHTGLSSFIPESVFMKRFAYGVLAFGALLAFTSAADIAQELKLFL